MQRSSLKIKIAWKLIVLLEIIILRDLKIIMVCLWLVAIISTISFSPMQ